MLSTQCSTNKTVIEQYQKLANLSVNEAIVQQTNCVIIRLTVQTCVAITLDIIVSPMTHPSINKRLYHQLIMYEKDQLLKTKINTIY